MIPVEQALARVFDLCRVLPSETVRLSDALGRVLAEPVTARRDQPPFAASAMDGYALSGEGTWQVVGEAAAGAASARTLQPGEALRIFTGAPVPQGADRVLIQENALRDGDRLSACELPAPGANIRPSGQDFRAGDTLSAPRHLRPVDLGLIAAMDCPEVRVTRRPVVAVISTGDELVHPGESARPDQITASNGYALQAMVREAGAEARLLPIARDTRDHLRAVLEMAQDVDVIVTSGGASVGDHDLVAPVLGEMGAEMAFHKLALRPGKPLMAGRLGAALVLGLPGNPVSAMVCAHLFLLPALRAMQGLGAWPTSTRAARLAVDLPANGPRRHYMRAMLEPGGLIRPVSSQDSARLGLMAQADALLVHPENSPARPAGAEVRYIPL